MVYNRRVGRITASDAEQERDHIFTMPEADLPADLGVTTMTNTTTPAERVSTPPAPRAYAAKLYTIDAIDPDGFPVHFAFADISIEQFEAKKAQMKELGYLPPTQAARAAVEEERKREAPVCEYHGAMKESTKRPGSWYCPARMGNGEYCKSKG